MRTVSEKEKNQIAMSGSKVRQLNKPKPPPKVVDHSDRLASIERALDAVRLHSSSTAEYSMFSRQSLNKDVERLSAEVHQLKSEVNKEDQQKLPTMSISRGPQGFINTVNVGRLLFKFMRNEYGSVIDVEVSRP